jgi:hypothetical protein
MVPGKQAFLALHTTGTNSHGDGEIRSASFAVVQHSHQHCCSCARGAFNSTLNVLLTNLGSSMACLMMVGAVLHHSSTADVLSKLW